MTSTDPVIIADAPRAMALSPDPQTLLMVKAGVSLGIPPAIMACRAGFWPWAAWRTLPMITYITDVGPLHLLMQERELLRDELREAIAIDEVTGMPNKVALLKCLESQISRSRRYNNPLSIVILRVNDLEQLDETQSAKLFLPISHLLNDQVRWADMVGKLSNSDFLLVLPETAADACKNLTDNLNNRLNDLSLPEDLPANYKISTSFGYAEWAKGDDLTLLMQKARKMLEVNHT